jgi:hypothetical protein
LLILTSHQEIGSPEKKALIKPGHLGHLEGFVVVLDSLIFTSRRLEGVFTYLTRKNTLARKKR